MKQERLSNLLTYLLAWVITTLPGPVFPVILAAAAYLISVTDNGLKKTIFHNLNAVFPQKPFLEKRRLARRVIYRAGMDIYQNKRLHRGDRVNKSVRIKGLENLENALKKGRGVIGLSAHLGNFAVLLSYLSRRFPVKTITNDPRNPYLARYVRNIRRLSDILEIPRKPALNSVKESLRWLRSGNLLFILADEYSRKGTLVLFFGRPVGTQTAPAVFARRLECAVLPVSIVRRGREHLVRIEPELEIRHSDNYEEDVRKNTEIFNRVIERWVKEDPEQWLGWMNRRFLPPKRRILSFPQVVSGNPD